MEEETGTITVSGQTIIKVGTSRNQSKTPAGNPNGPLPGRLLASQIPGEGSRDVRGRAADRFSLSGFLACCDPSSQLCLVR